MEEFVPINDRVLVRVDEPVQQLTTGLLRPSAQLEESLTGVVLAVGPDVNGSVSVGQRIQWSKYSGKPVTVDGEELKILYKLEINGYFREKQ